MAVDTKVYDKFRTFFEQADTPGKQAELTNLLLLELLKIMSEERLVISIGTFPEFWHDKITLETYPQPLKKDTFPLKKGVTIKADNDNTGTVYFGNNENLTSSNALRLEPGESWTLEIDDLCKVFIFGSAASQKADWLGI